jgi:hypothetical protein
MKGADYAQYRNIEKVIIGAYRWLSNHYRRGDKVFLFGKLCLSLTDVYGAELALRLFLWSFPGPGTCRHD